jgi:hypothetical protein
MDQKKTEGRAIIVPKIPGFNSGNKRIPGKALPSFNKLHLVVENEELENSPMRNKTSQQELQSFAMRAK